MKPTTTRLLATLAAVGLACAVTLGRLMIATSGTLMPVSAGAPVALAVMAAALLWWTLIVRRRLVHVARARHEKAGSGTTFVMRERPLPPIVAARTVALAFAGSRAGAYVVGWYAGIAITFLGHLDADDVRWRLVYAVLSSLLALGVVVIAVWLERSCTLPPQAPDAQASPA